MPKTPAKPASKIPAKPPAGPPARQKPAKAGFNPRLQADNRWQRTKRYGWDSR